MKSAGDILELACRRIADLDTPAYVKNSELRYIAVNEAYADFLGREISDFIGRRSRELFDRPEEEDREDKERRALVFGTEENAVCFDAAGVGHERIQIESFSPSPERIYVLGIFEDRERRAVAGRKAAGSSQAVNDSGTAADLAQVREALENLAHPIGIIAADGRPLIVNAAYRNGATPVAAGESAWGESVNELDVLRTVLEDLPVAVFVRDDKHRLVYANKYYETFSGRARSEYLGMTEHEMFGPEGAEAIYQENLLALRDGISVELESEMPSNGGHVYPVISRVNRVMTADGRTYVVGSFSDISPLKEREKALIESRKQQEILHRDIESILRSLPIGVLILDNDHQILYVNDEFYSIWELPLDDRFDGRPFIDVIRRNDELGRYDGTQTPEEIYAFRKHLFEAEEPEPIELGWAGGKSVIFDSRRISNDRILLTYADISAVREREKEIHETRAALERLGEMMRDATHAMSQGIAIVQDGIIKMSNEAMADILQIPPHHIEAGQGWLGMFEFCAARGDFHDAAEQILQEWRANIAARQPISTAFHVGGERWVNMDATVSRGQHWVALFTDVTELKSREEELRQLLSRAEAADRAKSEFLANMSHEIRTPMNGVLGMAELLAKTNLDARQKTFIDIIVKSGNALLTIINDILDFSKIDAGQMKLRKAAFDITEAVEDVATLLSSHAAEKNIELLVRAAPDLPAAVIGDAGRFRQIVTNLVGNAVKFTERGHVFVDVGFETIAGGEIMAIIRIEDTGIGIPREKLETVFDKFSQVDTSSTRRHEGTGLGLAITAGLVDLFGGYINVESEWGKGSVFTINLPLAVAAARLEPKPLPINVQGARILVVDDNEVNRRILTEQLSLWGFDGVAAEGGGTGLAILKAAVDLGVTVDAVVLDYHMPDMNGADVARRLRADPRFVELPIIFLTSMDISGTEKEFAALNGHAHLMKPARANVLRNTVVEVVRARRVKQASEAEIARLRVEAAVPAPAPALVPQKRTAEFVDVLVAEDNEVNQIVFTQILQSTGLSFLVVNNGQEAVTAWESHTPRIIMMDVSMPVMNGHEATRTIREREKGQGHRVPIIGVTAHALESDREACLDAGMDDYMSKPISPELLEEKIRQWLGKDELQPERTSY
ncbi:MULTISPECIES: response regulator [unclassified Rhizobium]|uniref:response regulator n=1 Tax=unclassified Rhizobium TaxID=2613769 RepID=UPI001C835184|nr:MULTISPECIES: response regulator [unclassified Rhizobium]MBX5215813.1 response regulator [Rhizobium sp. NLR9a]MBX5228114.1 response regulator [Rhizobium sp. NLR9b]MBX5246511.1 response regulator [Rhizobium sp. NLR3b]MBX5277113.1 response regulator [Rhizobium sp. NLR13a]MBX5288922.1 response regulator [Rhizobium sp. NLR10b]